MVQVQQHSCQQFGRCTDPAGQTKSQKTWTDMTYGMKPGTASLVITGATQLLKLF